MMPLDSPMHDFLLYLIVICGLANSALLKDINQLTFKMCVTYPVFDLSRYLKVNLIVKLHFPYITLTCNENLVMRLMRILFVSDHTFYAQSQDYDGKIPKFSAESLCLPQGSISCHPPGGWQLMSSE